MFIEEWLYLGECALASAIFYLLVVKFYFKKKFSLKDFGVYFILGFFISWGIDIIEKQSEIENYIDVLKVGLGAWALFVAPFGFRKIWNKELTKIEFKNEYGVELINYLIVASLIYYLT